jgi:hypothetical protein
MPENDPLRPRRPRLVRRVIKRLYRLPMRNRLALFEAVLWLARARLSLFFVPFNTLAARFGAVTPPALDTGIAPLLAEPIQEEVRRVGWAVTRAARYVPFRAVCLPQAIAAKAMLSRRGIASVMHFGVAKTPAELKAHAWLDAGRIEVTGYPVEAGFVEVARFV